MILTPSNTMTQGIEAAKRNGFALQCYVRVEKIHFRNTTKTYGNDQRVLVGYCRHKGTNDPGDRSTLFLIACNDGCKGYMTSAYGIYADTDAVYFALSLKRKDPK